MITYLNRQRGQSTLEYAILIIIIIAALLTIQNYIKRGVQGRLKSASDDIGDQFSPGNTNMVVAERSRSHERQLFGLKADGTAAQGVQSSKLLNKEITNHVSQAAIVNDAQEYWGK